MARLSWIVGGVFVAAAATEYGWRDNLTPAFAVIAGVGAALLMAAAAGTAARVARAGSSVSVIGVVLFAVGWATLLFGVGVILVPIGAALYVLGIVRARAISIRALIAVGALLALAVVAAALPLNQLVAIEFAAGAAIAAGIGSRRSPNRESRSVARNQP